MTTEQIQLVAIACSQGQFEQFGSLYDAFLERIYKFVYYRTGHKQTAEDLTSEVFMKALSSITTYRPDRASFSTWLYTIARNVVIDHSRASKPTEGLEGALEVMAADNPFKDAANRLELEKVLVQLRGFSSREQDIVLMRVWDGMSHQEIGAVLGMSEASVKMQYSRTLKALQQKVGISALVGFACVWNQLIT